MSWVLYHGTSTARLACILKDGGLRKPTWGDQKLSLTTERSVAEYFACNAVFGDKHDPGRGAARNEESNPVVLVVDGEGLLELNYDLSAFNDQGECDCENEIACWDDIEPLDEVLMAVEPVPVPPERYRVLIERGIEACIAMDADNPYVGSAKADLRRARRRAGRRRAGELGVARPRRATGTIFHWVQ
jgi:hypothetical protein